MRSKKITVRFSARLKAEMQEAVIRAGYGFHGKSKWLSEAVTLFLQQSNYIDFVEHCIDINQADLRTVEAFYVDIESHKKIKNALVDVRMKYPLFEGVQSALIRSCVVFRLVFNKIPPGGKFR